jgi:hypothetical protein
VLARDWRSSELDVLPRSLTSRRARSGRPRLLRLSRLFWPRYAFATHSAVVPRAGGRLHGPDDAQVEPRQADLGRHAIASVGHRTTGSPRFQSRGRSQPHDRIRVSRRRRPPSIRRASAPLAASVASRGPSAGGALASSRATGSTGTRGEAPAARPDQQRRRASPALLLTQAERKPPSAARAAGRRLLDCTSVASRRAMRSCWLPLSRKQSQRLQLRCRRHDWFGPTAVICRGALQRALGRCGSRACRCGTSTATERSTLCGGA